MFFTMPFDDIATGTTDNTYKTMASIIVADTAGHRCRLRSLIINPSDDVPQDLNVGLEIKRIADLSAGSSGTPGATVSTSNMPHKDPESIDSLMSGGRNYSAEPTTYETEPVYQTGFNARGGLVKHWDIEEAPTAIADQLLGLLACPRGTTAAKLSGSLGFEMF